MSTTAVRRALLPGATVAVAVVLAAGCGTGNAADDNEHDNDNASPASPAAEAQEGFNAADVEFAQNMIVHHEQALAMAELAETRASDPELVALAGDIWAAQQPEITTMTGWLDTWGEPVEPPGGHEQPGMPGMAPGDEMAALEKAAGVEFDRSFTRMMIAHHDGAIEMAGQVRTDGVNRDVDALAATIAQTQQAEVVRLEGILDRL